MGRCLNLNNWLVLVSCLVLTVAILTYSTRDRDMSIYHGLYHRAALFFSPPSTTIRASVTSSNVLPAATRLFSHTMAANEEKTNTATVSSAEQPQQGSNTPLALPAAEEGAQKLDVSGAGGSVKLDHLGPLVVNQDGTLSRIANWDKMTEIEKKNTLRVLGKRNKLRMDALKAANKDNDNAGEKVEG